METKQEGPCWIKWARQALKTMCCTQSSVVVSNIIRRLYESLLCWYVQAEPVVCARAQSTSLWSPLHEHRSSNLRALLAGQGAVNYLVCWTGKCAGDRNAKWPEVWSRALKSTPAAFLAVLSRVVTELLRSSEDHFHICRLEANMTPQGIQALGGFSEGDRIPENLSILTYTEEEEVHVLFDDDWDEHVVAAPSRSRSPSVESIWSSCSTSSVFSVLGVCTTPNAQAKKATPRRVSTPLRKSVEESQSERSLLRVASMPPLYRPSQLGISLFNINGDQLGADTTQ